MSRRFTDPKGLYSRVAVLLVLGVAAWVARDWLVEPGPPGTILAADAESGEQAVLDFFESRRSGDMVAVTGIVDAVLPDDNDGSRHQRFIVRLESGHTLLVAHNIDLARKVPLGSGDRVSVRGEYEWNDRGGVLHWTHHDPAGGRAGGWIELDGERYR